MSPEPSLPEQGSPPGRRPELQTRHRREIPVLLPAGRASFLRVTVLGILAGALGMLFLHLPENRLWAFPAWSTDTWGFWMFSVSLLVLFSETRASAALHAGWFVFLLFLLTTVHQSFSLLLSLWRTGQMSLASVPTRAAGHLGGWLAYSVPPALLCAALGAVFWSVRSRNAWGGFLRAVPAAFLLGETLFWLCRVLVLGTGLFSALSDLLCLIAWPVVLSRASSEPEPRGEEPQDTGSASPSPERPPERSFFRSWVLPVLGIVEIGGVLLGFLFLAVSLKAGEHVELARETSPDGAWTLRITELGEPDWPFGSDHLQVQLWENTEDPLASNYRVSFQADVANDGCQAHWEIRWLEDRVQVTLTGSEQPDARYELPYPAAAG